MREESWEGDCAGKKERNSQNNFRFSLRLYGCKGKTKKKFTVPVNLVPADVKAPFEE